MAIDLGAGAAEGNWERTESGQKSPHRAKNPPQEREIARRGFSSRSLFVPENPGVVNALADGRGGGEECGALSP